MSDHEQQLLHQIRSILKHEEQILGRQQVLLQLKQAILDEVDIGQMVDLVASDPALAANLIWRGNLVLRSWSPTKKLRSLKEALIRLGQVNIYRYAFSFYLKSNLEGLAAPYDKLAKGYWALNESIAAEAVDALEALGDSDISPDEVQTLGLFSLFGQIMTLSAASVLSRRTGETVPPAALKKIIDNHQQQLTLLALSSVGLDADLQIELLIAFDQMPATVAQSPGVVLKPILRKKGIR
ncbi:HDOD domain-containing protein [Paraferrimonas sedimenticola]|uniref:Histidine kinase n=1 Tax=Paraferrimonas sedimenticola TaxID=375674 RepID=A0AA37VZV2_9GAMM|nr:HDOD domain-containing protein [Paraferrimonas sedimenticola]GLP97509.1 histidine kinase [Paraferrimonas sedimenticola]